MRDRYYNLSMIAFFAGLFISLSGFTAPAYPQVQVKGVLNANDPQSISQLANYDETEEKRMIKQKSFAEDFSIRVTTVNQRRFDRNRDGFLSGRELDRYLRYYR